jgi:hypothetical protein
MIQFTVITLRQDRIFVFMVIQKIYYVETQNIY